ncbi:hypothetical protein HYDPIDRAFT_34653 [Hydnomerulius pinastri MD-312]|uniref:Uncharacterized protein n=1 Tax=Hydnomerulius pinastri MD-312 TaxID=994086 RepID=A0A0C9UY28_9AGAM|nr:hypothetical protein HYDPIDRAFT_34653 [Hydnomerulius pinastri MD-312]
MAPSPLHQSAVALIPAEDDTLPLSLRRSRRNNRRLPLRFRDMLPEFPLPLPPQDHEGQVEPASGCPDAEPPPSKHVQLQVAPVSTSNSPHADKVPEPRPTLKTDTNSFGLFRLYDEGSPPSHDPQNCLDTENAVQPHQVLSPQQRTTTDSPFHPYPNESSFRLGDWYWNEGMQQSRRNFQKLIEIVGGSEFRAEDIRTTNWTAIDRELGDLDTAESATTDAEEWLDADAGWIRTPVTISVPFHRRSLHPGPKDYSVNDFYHRSLMSIIRGKLLDPTHHKFFHYEPYELRWQPPHKARDLGVHGELFTSASFLEAHRNLQDSPKEPGCDLPRRIVALMFWSDATQLTTFSDAKLWPLYVYLGNETKDKRGQPTAYLCTHAAYFQSQLPDSFKDFVLENTGGKLPGDAFFTHCRRELFHAQWRVLLDDDFVYAYTHGLALTCCDGVKRRLYPRIFTYSADYPEKVLIACIRNLGACPCPRCLIPKDRVHNMGSERDMLQRHILARSDTEERRRKVTAARRLIYEQQYVVDTPQVEALLKDESLVPTVNAFSDRLGHLSFNLYLMLVVDLLHEFELGVWKAVFIHLLRMLDSMKGNMLSHLDHRYRQVPTFGRGTVRRFGRNVSELKRMTARDFEDLLQCAIPVFAGLFPESHHSAIIKLLFLLAHWHGMAKLRMHTDETLGILENVTKALSEELRKFVTEICPAFAAKELRREAECRRRRQAREGGGGVTQTQGAANKGNDRHPKVLNLKTYKLHALGDYAAQIRRYGTTDSYSTQPGELEHRLAAIERRQARIRRIRVRSQREALTGDDPVPDAPDLRHVIGKSQNYPADLTKFVQSNLDDPAAKDFSVKLKRHLLPRIQEIHVGKDCTDPTLRTPRPPLEHSETDDESFFTMLNQVVFKGNRIYQHNICRINYTTYDLRRETETINPKSDHRDIMLLAHTDGTSIHPFCYARVLGIYHSNVIYTGPGARDYLSRRVEFLWVRWFELMDGPAGYDHCALDIAKFVPMANTDAFGFVDPADVLRCCQLIPAYAEGRLHPDGIGMSRGARDCEDWKFYYINRFVDRDMVMRYHWGMGVGHVYAYTSSSTNGGQQDNSQFVSGLVDDAETSLEEAQDDSNEIQELEDDSALWTEMDYPTSDESNGGADSDSDVLVDAMYESDEGEDSDVYDGYKF